jgi:hypothetical protein
MLLRRIGTLGATLATIALLAAAPALAQNPDTRTLHSWDEPVTLADGQETTHRYVISYTYSTNTATQAIYDAAGTLLAERPLGYMPEPNEEEIADAITVIEADPELATLLARSDLMVEGGFIKHEGPCARTRCLQFEITPAGSTRLERFVVVDLSAREVIERDLFPHLRD